MQPLRHTEDAWSSGHVILVAILAAMALSALATWWHDTFPKR